MEIVGFIGLGNMGGAMAERIQKAGHSLVVYDLREAAAIPFRESGAQVATSPAEVARGCTVIFTSLPSPKEVEQVALGSGGLIEGIQAGSVYVDLTTSSATLIRRIQNLFQEKGVQVLDAPLSGGRAELLRGEQEVTVGGDPQTLERVRPILGAFANQILHAGPVGSGTICKLVHNQLMRGVYQVMAEGMTLGVKAGVDAEILWEAVRRGLFGKMNPLHVSLPQGAFRGQYDSATYTLDLALKDLALATELAREFRVPMPVANLVEQINIEAVNRGWGQRSSGIPFVLQEEAAGVQVRANIDAEKAARYITTHPEATEESAAIPG